MSFIVISRHAVWGEEAIGPFDTPYEAEMYAVLGVEKEAKCIVLELQKPATEENLRALRRSS